MRYQGNVRGNSYKKVCILSIGLMHIHYSIYFHYVLFVIVKAQVRDLDYNSSNLYSNYIIRHVLTKWTEYSLGICGWGIRMVLKGLA